jgi:hypothetical protein
VCFVSSTTPDDNFYASALADKISGIDQDPGEADINANFNSDFDWYLGTDGNTPNNQYDLTSVVLHELGHGLGFVSSKDYDEGNGEGSFGLGFQQIPLNYDEFLTSGPNGTPLLDLPNNSVSLGDAFTSNNVYNDSPEAIAALGGTAPRIYAPAEYAGGSSISHWNESTFTAGDPNSLMTPQIGSGEAIHNPGAITLGLFEDMGWTLCENVNIDCAIDPLTLDGPESICPGETTIVEVTNPPIIPSGGAIAIEFLNVSNQEIINLTGVTLPYSFDNDLNGVLSANSIAPFVGEYELTAFIYTDVNNLAGSTCAISSAPITVFFLESTNPACGGEVCSIEPLVLDGPESICPGETTTVNTPNPAEVPDGGGIGIQFVEVSSQDAINLTGIALPYTFDNDLNGLLSANDFDPFEGEYELLAFVYSNPADVNGSVCAVATNAITVFFLNENDPECGANDPCSIAPLVLDGPESICPGETTVVETVTPAEVPLNGGVGIAFLDLADQSIINLTSVTLPYSFDNDLNGLLSSNGFDPFIGEFELTAFVYTDVNDLEGTTCAMSSSPLTVFFLSANDPACNPDPVPCDEWETPTPTTGYVDFNNEFGGAPCDDGSGCPFNEIQGFEVWGSEAYTVDNFIAGGTYTFSMCNGPGAGSWVPDFTIIAPSGTIDAFGLGDGCSITWTASEDGTYLIVINEAGNCGVGNQIDNGYPALTCEDGTAECFVEPCSIDALILDGPESICPEITTTVETENAAEVPAGGGIAIAFLNVATQENINLTGVELPYTFDNDLNGVLSANNLDPFVGEYELTAFVYEDATDLAGSTCATANGAVTVNFLAENDPACVNGVNDKTWDHAWEVYPNPAEDEVTVNISAEVNGAVAITFYDASGRVVQQESNIQASGQNNSWKLNIANLNPGVYYIIIENPLFKATKPLLISK